jgi:hypothetical protein
LVPVVISAYASDINILPIHGGKAGYFHKFSGFHVSDYSDCSLLG